MQMCAFYCFLLQIERVSDLAVDRRRFFSIFPLSDTRCWYIDKKIKYLIVTDTSLSLIEHETEKTSPSPTTLYKDSSVLCLDHSCSRCIRWYHLRPFDRESYPSLNRKCPLEGKQENPLIIQTCLYYLACIYRPRYGLTVFPFSR